MHGKEDGFSKAELELISLKSWPELFILTHWCFAVGMNLLVTMWALFSRERMPNLTGQLVEIRVYLNALLSIPAWVQGLGNALPSAWIFGFSAWGRQMWTQSVLYSLITHIPTHLELLTRFALNSDASNVLNVEPVILSLCWTTAEWLNKAEKVLGQNGFWESFMGCTRLHYFRQLE